MTAWKRLECTADNLSARAMLTDIEMPDRQQGREIGGSLNAHPKTRPQRQALRLFVSVSYITEAPAGVRPHGWF
jgi:hypothetical protein